MSPERFIDLIRVEQETLRRFLLALCGGDESLADDIAQDALVRACRFGIISRTFQVQYLALQDSI